MRDTCLNIITQLTVELHKDDISKEKLGTGVLYTNRKLSGVVYVLTAKHCLLKYIFRSIPVHFPAAY
jgi:hypothetical protein